MVRWNKLGIIAGGGSLPLAIAEQCQREQKPVHIISLKGMMDKPAEGFDCTECDIVQAGRIFSVLRAENCDAVVMAGNVKRPDFKSMRPDWRGTALLARLSAAALKGDGALLATLVDVFEAEGFLVIGAEEAMGHVTPDLGAMGQIAPDEDDLHDIAKARSVIEALGPYDVGQGAIVAEGQVLAIEAAEGTDAMLERCIGLQQQLSIATPRGVLVKIPKPGQELRVDLPTIGPLTIEGCERAGLRGIALKAGAALILERETTCKLAEQAGLFLYGFANTK